MKKVIALLVVGIAGVLAYFALQSDKQPYEEKTFPGLASARTPPKQLVWSSGSDKGLLLQPANFSCLSANGRWLAISSSVAEPAGVEIWDLHENRRAFELDARRMTVYSIAWSRDGTHLGVGFNGDVGIWRFAEGSDPVELGMPEPSYGFEEAEIGVVNNLRWTKEGVLQGLSTITDSDVTATAMVEVNRRPFGYRIQVRPFEVEDASKRRTDHESAWTEYRGNFDAYRIADGNLARSDGKIWQGPGQGSVLDMDARNSKDRWIAVATRDTGASTYSFAVYPTWRDSKPIVELKSQFGQDPTVRFSNDGIRVALIDFKGVTVWNCETQEIEWQFDNMSGPFGFHFLPDSNQAVLAQSRVELWSLPSNVIENPVDDHTVDLSGVAFVSNTQVLTAGRDGDIRRWTVSEPHSEVLVRHERPITALSLITSKPENFAFADLSGGIYLRGSVQEKILQLPSVVHSMASNGSKLVGFSDQLSVIKDLVTLESTGLNVDEGVNFLAAAISSDGTYYAAGAFGGPTTYVETVSSEITAVPGGGGGLGLAPVAFQPDSHCLACKWTSDHDDNKPTDPDWGRRMQLFDCKTKTRLWTSPDLAGDVSAIDFTADGKRIAVATLQLGWEVSKIEILNSQTGERITSFDTDARTVIRYLDWSPDGKRLITAGNSPRATVWSVPE
jgi:WD40 repeat protein